MNLNKPNIYIVDNSLNIVELVTSFLMQNGFNVITFGSAEQCLQSLEYLKPDALIIDLSMIGTNGRDFCKLIKSNKELKSIHIIIISNCQEESSMLDAFNNGADDYLVKPFKLRELYIRLNRLLDHKDAIKNEHPNLLSEIAVPKPIIQTRKQRSQTIKVRDMNINLSNYEVSVNSKKLTLSYGEFQLLVLLVNKSGTPCSREEIIKNDGGQSYIITDRAVDVRIAGLRKKLGRYSRMIKTIRSVGYMFVEI
jgi:DNA-binding response OmpR family regulator